MQFPFNCQGIINRPMMYGSQGIIDLIKDAKANGKEAPEYQFDKTNNNANCAMQIANPATAGHAYDNFTLRRDNMAKYFAEVIDTCGSNNMQFNQNKFQFSLSPNPIKQGGTLMIQGGFPDDIIVEILDVTGVAKKHLEAQAGRVMLTEDILPGVYLIKVRSGIFTAVKRLVVVE